VTSRDAEVITSASNPFVKRLRQLASRKVRQREGVAVVHGIQPVWQAVEAGAAIETIAYAPGRLGHEAAVAMVLDQERRGIRVLRLSDELFERLSDRDTPAGLAAIVRQQVRSLADLDVSATSTFVALQEVGNPGNLGTIIRTADATGATAVVLIGPTADPYDPGAMKASMGAIFHVPVARVDDLGSFLRWARDRGITVATTAPRARDSLWTADYPGPLAVLMGSEGAGLSDADLGQGTLQISIPMVGTAESLNLAVATGVVLYEVWRRRAT
jgi:TrmH family RNA methyltransferase